MNERNMSVVLDRPKAELRPLVGWLSKLAAG